MSCLTRAHRFQTRSLFLFTFLLLLLAIFPPATRAQISWTPLAAPTSQNLWSIAHRPATNSQAPLFVAVGESGTILTSPDGLTWTARTSGTTRWLTSVAWITGLFIAVGENATVLVSPDGLTWTPRTVTTDPNAPRLNAVTYGNGTYLAVADDGSTYTSPDTLTWRQQSSRLFRARGLVFAYGNFVVTGESGRIATSLTGSDFNFRASGTSPFLESVTYARRTFVAVGATGTILTSQSAERWTAPPLPATASSATLRGVTFFNHHFVAVGEAGAVLTSPDALTWTPRPLPFSAAPLFTAVAASDTVALAVGHAGAIYRSTLSTAPVAILTPPQPITEAVGSHVLFSVVATGPGPLTYQWSFDGLPITAPDSNTDTLLLTHIQLSQSGRYHVVVSAAGGTAQSASAALTVIPAFAAPTALIDSTFLATPSFNSAPVTALEQPDGKIVAGGHFTFLVNGTAQTGLARLNLDGSLDPTFNPGSGISGPTANVTALALTADGRILLGGSFTAVSGTPRANLARLLTDGSLDPAFTPAAALATSPIAQILTQPDGKVLVVTSAAQLRRLNADGSLDAGFALPDSFYRIERAALASDGKILVAGANASANHGLSRLNPNGTSDPTFPTSQLGANGPAQFIRVITGDRIIVGSFLSDIFGAWSVQRFNRDGSRDASAPALGSALFRTGIAFAADAAGRVLLQSQFTADLPSTPGNGHLTRFNVDGSIDATLRRAAGAAPDPLPRAIVPLANGKILLVGDFTSIDGTPRLRVARTVAANAVAPNLPVIATVSPQIVTARAGDPVTLNVTTAGTQPFATVWTAGNSPPGLASADGSTYTILNPQSNGLYTATFSNPAGAITSPAFLVLVTPSVPRLVSAPVTLSVNSGRTAVFTADTRGSGPFSYQWFFNTTPVGTNSPTLVVGSVSAVQAGDYTVVIRNSLGTVTTAPALLTVDDTSRLANLATRGTVGLGENVLTTGFVLRGPVPRTLLIRGIGPGLTPFGVTGTVPNPSLTLFDAAGIKLAENDDWNTANSGATAAVFQLYGAFALANGSADAALVRTLAPGAYTVQISTSATSTSTPGLPADAAAASGLALAEIYEADALPTRLVNLSSRLLVGEGASVAIPGVVIAGTVPRQLLIRAIGPALAPFGVTGFLADPTLTLTAADGTVIATNNDWSTNANAAALATATAAVGAFALSPNSRDAALLLTVPPGNYTAQISTSATSTSTSTPGLPAAAAAASGLALVEIYEVP